MTNHIRLLASLAIIVTSLNLPCIADTQEKADRVAGKILEVKGSAYLRIGKDAGPVRLDPEQVKNLELHAGEGLRCDAGSVLKVELYGEVVPIAASDYWYLIPHVPSHLGPGEAQSGGIQANVRPSDRDPFKAADRAGKADTAATAESATSGSLYAALGGRPKITLVVDEFVQILSQDIRINSYFQDIRINSYFLGVAADEKRLAPFKTRLVEQICEASDGPCKSTRGTMNFVVPGPGVVVRYSLVEDLTEALTRAGIAQTTQSELFRKLYQTAARQ